MPLHHEPQFTREYLDEYEAESLSELGQAIIANRWNLVQQYTPNGGLLFDLGCGSGHFLMAAPGGYICKGYDPNPHGKYLNWVWGFNPEILTMWDVIEHLDVPYAPFNYWVPKPKWVFISTPNIDNAELDSVTSWKHVKPGEHKYYFCLKSLIAMMYCNGYEVVDSNWREGLLRDPSNPLAIVTVVGRRMA